MNKTEKLFYNYTSAAPLAAEIREVRPGRDGTAEIILDRTIFYPEGGGQPADRGTINGVPLLDVREKDGEVLHLVSAAEAGKLKPGPAGLVLDARRRRDFTVLHTAQHLLSGVIMRMVGAPTVSMHLGDETCTIDVDTPGMSDEILVALEETAADAIEQNHPVITHLCPPEDVSSFPLRKLPPRGEEVIRVVEIEGNDFSPCCGTHLRSTAEIGLLRVLGAEKYKGMIRLGFLAGRRLLLESRLLYRNAGIVSRALKVPLDEAGKGVLDFLEKTARTEKHLRALEEEAVRVKAEALLSRVRNGAAPGDAGPHVPAIVVESYNSGIDEILSIGRAAQKQTQTVLILASEQDLKFAAFCSAKGFDLRPLLKEAFETQGGRGGGGPSFFQGNFGTPEALKAFLQAVQDQEQQVRVPGGINGAPETQPSGSS